MDTLSCKTTYTACKCPVVGTQHSNVRNTKNTTHTGCRAFSRTSLNPCLRLLAIEPRRSAVLNLLAGDRNTDTYSLSRCSPGKTTWANVLLDQGQPAPSFIATNSPSLVPNRWGPRGTVPGGALSLQLHPHAWAGARHVAGCSPLRSPSLEAGGGIH
jgi:hypothetical protein